MNKAFITNSPDAKSLKKRLYQLIIHSEELKFLVGFFYFSGWQEIYEALKSREDLNIKILVGLQVDSLLGRSLEVSDEENNLSGDEKADRFFDSLGKALNNEELDIQPFYEQVDFFISLIEKERLIIRKTLEPNHAKLYLFKMKPELQGLMAAKFITGSSNLTRAGMLEQNEFNVEIGDYGTDEAEKYFDTLWETAVKISENDYRRTTLIDIIRNKSQAATVTPYEGYAMALKNYLEVQEQRKVKPQIIRLLESKGYNVFSYQVDAVNQALTVLENYHGVIIADVVGLGKSVIASMIAKNIGKRGMVLCPPGLIGDNRNLSGWNKYRHDFELYDWEIRSSGDLEAVAEYMTEYGQDIEVIVVDEVHRFRNQDTAAYEHLSNICRNRQVIMLTATPFNNSPADIFALLKLFIVPGKSKISLDDNLEARFASYNYLFKRLSFISKNWNSSKVEKRKKTEKYYQDIFGTLPIDLNQVKLRSQRMGKEMRGIIEPVLIRRNRIDLKKDSYYKEEVKNLPVMQNPSEMFYSLDKKQSIFYDQVINDYFGDGSQFTGAIYRPFAYEKQTDLDDLDESGNRELQQQQNLYDFMRRLLVKRFESSFGAFAKSINSFIRVHSLVLEFINNSGGKYILDRSLLEKIYQLDQDEIEKALEEFASNIDPKKLPKNQRIYNVYNFQYKEKFIADVNSDLSLLKKIREQIINLKLVDNDPKAEKLIELIKEVINGNKAKGEPVRKVIIFTEFIDTVSHLRTWLENSFSDHCLFVEGQLTSSLAEKVLNNFDAGVKKRKQEDKYKILVTSDKLSEGFNLNRAGAVVNYDIPWNPTRVIQRVGRINRIGQKIFNELYLYNFFPTEQGSDIVKSREIAGQKMYLIHNTLGEDAKIFEIDETPTASELYTRINVNPDDLEDESLSTKIRSIYFKIMNEHPEVINKISALPVRVKTAKAFESNHLTVIRRKGLGLFVQHIDDTRQLNADIEYLLFEEALEYLECEFTEPKIRTSINFWPCYERIKSHQESYSVKNIDTSIEIKAFNNLISSLKYFHTELEDYVPFIRTLIKDLKEYRTLSKYSLRRIASVDLIPDKKTNLKQFAKEIAYLRNYLGESYLEEVERKLGSTKSEVIIAYENVYME